MSKLINHRHIWFVCLFLGMLALLSGCGLPTCTNWEDLRMPEVLSPEEAELVDSLTPTLTWDYPDDATCWPAYFGVQVFTDWTINNVILYTTTTGETFVWPADQPLEPGEIYYWSVYPFYRMPDGSEGSGRDITFSWFYTGPECERDYAMMPVELMDPPDDSVLSTTDGINFEWQDPTTCTLLGEYQLEISENASFPPGQTERESHWRRTGVWSWSEWVTFETENCAHYYWRVKTDPDGALEGPYSETWSFYIRDPGTVCPLFDLGTLIEPPPWAIETRALQDTFCRTGPGSFFDPDTILPEGQTMHAVGRDQDCDWLQVLLSDMKSCWVWRESLEEIEDCESLEESASPPTPTAVPPTLVPTPTAVDCSQFSPNVCGQYPACYWDPTYPPNSNGSCRNK